ncbi:relaxase domain-containing protein [Acidiphilium sp. PA]|uniref:MobF family relaxase n=1 Tax=Acidiphilium sp. PA TaxID=2871705 RepID=UPI0022435EFB|nr:MobF family relaxase [Acidiphilium sp. PA]MCW8308913.1 relaxase domain-containing protein [Acidiphilium sp. PA]
MISFRKIMADSNGQLIMQYFTENTPDPAPKTIEDLRGQVDSGGRMTNYYTGRDTRASWGPDISPEIAASLGIDRMKGPSNAALAHLFEGKRADTGEAWSGHKREISGYDLTIAPHKSVTLAAEFGTTAAEREAVRYAIMLANDDTMRFVGEELGWARKGKGGGDGADPGDVAWISFYHHTARPTVHIEDKTKGVTYLADIPIPGDPHEHIHNVLLNFVLTDEGRAGSLDTNRLHSRVHEFGAYFQARLGGYLRNLGFETGMDAREQAVTIAGIPQIAVDTFSKGRKSVERNAKAYAADHGEDWESLPADRKYAMLQAAEFTARLKKTGDADDRASWRAQAEAIGWTPESMMDPDRPVSSVPAIERYERAYAYAARHLEIEFRTAAVLDFEKLRIHAARGFIGTGIRGPHDIDEVVNLLIDRGIEVKGVQSELIVGREMNEIPGKPAEKTPSPLRVTHTAQLRLEEALMERARSAASSRAGALTTAAIQRAIANSDLDLTSEPEQAKAQIAAMYALGTGGDLSILIGVAGSGKTALLAPLVQAYKEDGRSVFGVATAWRQADALADAGIDRSVDRAGLMAGGCMALTPFLGAIERGELVVNDKTVLILDEISQIGPKPFLKLLEFQARTGMVIKGIGDPEQVQTIDAGNTIKLLKEILPPDSLPYIDTTIRQNSVRERQIATLFRDGMAAKALTMKREDGTARLVGGDYDQVVQRIADFYIERRDILRAAGAWRGITISALTNEDAGNISRAVRERLKARGDVAQDEIIVPALMPMGDGKGEHHDLPIAAGDKLRLFRRVRGTPVDAPQRNGRSRGTVAIGNNGTIVTVIERRSDGLVLEGMKQRRAFVPWDFLTDQASGRVMLGHGHALTIDSAQGVTSDEHINALPRGSSGITSFKGYTAESRHVRQSFTMISEAAVMESIKLGRALGDNKPITIEDLWGRVAADMADHPAKANASDVEQADREDSDVRQTTTLFRLRHHFEMAEQNGRRINQNNMARRRSDLCLEAFRDQASAFRETLDRQERLGTDIERRFIPALDKFPETLQHLALGFQAELDGRRSAPNGPTPQ